MFFSIIASQDLFNHLSPATCTCNLILPESSREPCTPARLSIWTLTAQIIRDKPLCPNPWSAHYWVPLPLCSWWGGSREVARTVFVWTKIGSAPATAHSGMAECFWKEGPAPRLVEEECFLWISCWCVSDTEAALSEVQKLIITPCVSHHAATCPFFCHNALKHAHS